MNGLFEEIDGNGAQFSMDGTYRYTLTRQWDDGECVAFILFNPSTATAEVDDPTIRRCIGFAKRWGYGRLVILNLYAIRGTNPKTPARVMAPIGPMNDYWIAEACKEAREVVMAWGCAQYMPSIGKRIENVCNMIDDELLPMKKSCLGYRKDGHPRHPLMLSYETEREPFMWRVK